MTEKIIIDMRASLFNDAGELTFSDGNFADRIGWREIVVSAADNIAVTGAVRANDLSAQLTDFPTDLVSPPADKFAQFTFELSDSGGVVETADMSPEKHDHDHAHGDDHHHTDETAGFSGWWIVIGVAVAGAILIMFRQVVSGGRVVTGG